MITRRRKCGGRGANGRGRAGRVDEDEVWGTYHGGNLSSPHLRSFHPLGKRVDENFFPLSTYSPLAPSSKSITPAQTSLVSEFASGMNTARAVVCISLKGPMAVIGVTRCLLCGLFPRRSCL